MIGNCNLVLIYNKNNHDEKWLTREDYIVGKSHYKYLMPLRKDIEKDMVNPLKLASFKDAVLNLFADNVSDRYLGIMTTDRQRKLDINTYRLISKILKLTSYKFNKKTQKLIKIHNKK
jgi:hypothetical protein